MKMEGRCHAMGPDPPNKEFPSARYHPPEARQNGQET